MTPDMRERARELFYRNDLDLCVEPGDRNTYINFAVDFTHTETERLRGEVERVNGLYARACEEIDKGNSALVEAVRERDTLQRQIEELREGLEPDELSRRIIYRLASVYNIRPHSGPAPAYDPVDVVRHVLENAHELLTPNSEGEDQDERG